jgi:hypothetical protein
MPDRKLILDCLSEIQRLAQDAKKRGDIRDIASRGYELSQNMLDQITSLNAIELVELVNNLSRVESGFLQGIARSMAIKSVREANSGDLRYGIIALVIEDRRDDWRETLVKLCLLNHSAEKLGANLESIYLSVRFLATPETALLIDSYFKSGERDIHAMGYREDTSSEGFTYTRTW